MLVGLRSAQGNLDINMERQMHLYEEDKGIWMMNTKQDHYSFLFFLLLFVLIFCFDLFFLIKCSWDSIVGI